MIKLSKCSVGELEKQAVCNVIDRNYLGMGIEVKLFEEELKEFINTENEVICVNTGTSALHLSLLCMGIGPGDEVLVPSLTYVASFQAISATGAKPIACDIKKESLFININDAERKITKRTKAIMPVHYASNSVEIYEVYHLAKEYNLRVIEDAAHSFGCTRNGNRIGFEGDTICFSFDGIKNITSGEGGAVVTSDLQLANKIKDARLLGVHKDTEMRFSGQRSWKFDVNSQGFRYHMSDIMAAIGRVQLSRFIELSNMRRKIAKIYTTELKNINKLKSLNLNYDEIVPHIYPVIFESEYYRNKIENVLTVNEIETGKHYQPNHMLNFYYDDKIRCPVSENIYSKILTLPLHPSLNEENIKIIVDLIKFNLK